MWQLSLFLMLNVNLQSCTETELILQNEEKTYNIDFFNILFHSKEDRMIACKFLEESEKIELEEEPLIENAYYIYIDNQLLQERLVDEDLARVNVSFAGYRHDLNKQEVLTISEYQSENKKNRSIAIISGFFGLFLICAFVAWRL